MGFKIGQSTESSGDGSDKRFVVVVHLCSIGLAPKDWGAHIMNKLKFDPAEHNTAINIHMVAIKGSTTHNSVFNYFPIRQRRSRSQPSSCSTGIPLRCYQRCRIELTIPTSAVKNKKTQISSLSAISCFAPTTTQTHSERMLRLKSMKEYTIPTVL